MEPFTALIRKFHEAKLARAPEVDDATKPDGTPRKLLDVSLLTRLGWLARIRLEDGLRETYRAFAGP